MTELARILRGMAAASIVLALMVTLSACGSSEPSAPSPSPTSDTVQVIGGLPSNDPDEPPWDGEQVFMSLRSTSYPMAPEDWRLYINGAEASLDRPPMIISLSEESTSVIFILERRFTEAGDYDFRAVFAPDDGPSAESSWQYTWSP